MKIKEKYHSLYFGLRTKESGNLVYPLIYFFRRIMFVLFATNWTSYPFFQVMVLNFMNSLYFSYVGYMQPNE